MQAPTRATTTVSIGPHVEPFVFLQSDGGPDFPFALGDLRAVLRGEAPLRELRSVLATLHAPPWVGYPLGSLVAFSLETRWQPSAGLHFQVTSQVPVGMGVASSASLCVATLQALRSWSAHDIDTLALARAAQQVEHQVIGAPCGLMDQLAVLHARPGHLIPIDCARELALDLVALPVGLAVVGWPSGARHDNTGDAYRRARAAAFMGRRRWEVRTKRTLPHLSRIDPDDLADAMGWLPVTEFGQDHQVAYGDLGDLDGPSGGLEPATAYPVRAAVAFASHEHRRTLEAIRLLRDATPSHQTGVALGQLLLASHDDYSRIGLGSDVTDRQVAVIRATGPERGCYGARVSGGGCGGTVVALVATDAIDHLENVAMDHNGQPLIRSA